MSDIDITGLSKAEVLRVLYDRAQPQGMGMLHHTPGNMSKSEAQDIITNREDKESVLGSNYLYFDYLQGRVMKVDLKGNTLDPRLYDRDNGQDAVLKALQAAGLVP